MSDNIGRNTEEAICPWCGAEQEVNEIYGYDDCFSTEGNRKCEKCGKYFEWVVRYLSTKADAPVEAMHTPVILTEEQEAEIKKQAERTKQHRTEFNRLMWNSCRPDPTTT